MQASGIFHFLGVFIGYWSLGRFGYGMTACGGKATARSVIPSIIAVQMRVRSSSSGASGSYRTGSPKQILFSCGVVYIGTKQSAVPVRKESVFE